MRDRHEVEVLTELEREARRDPVLRELSAELARLDGHDRPGGTAASARACWVLVVGLVTMLLGCVVASVPLSSAGIVAALVGLVLAAWPADGARPPR